MTDEHTAPTDTSDPSDTGPGRERGRGRSIAAGLVGIVAVLGLLGGVLGIWTIRTATDSARFERRIDDLLQDEAISDALARRVVADVVDAVGIRDAIDEVVPEVMLPVVDLLAAGVRSRVEDRVAELVRTPEVAASIAAAAGRAHELAIDVLEDDAAIDGVEVLDGAVTVNLLPLTARTLTAMQEVGLLRDVDVPQLDRAGDPDQQRAELAAALGRDLPPEFGTPVVFRSESLAQAGDTVQLLRDVFLLAKRTVWFLFLGGLLLAGVSIWLARERLRAATFVVAGMFLSALVIRLVGSAAESRVPEAVEGPGAKATVRQIATGLEDSLNRTMAVYALLGLLALAAAVTVRFDLVSRLRRTDA